MEAGAPSGHWTATLRKEGFKHLEPGQRYRVAAEFADYDGNIHPAGESWRFLTHSFMPHEDGLSLFVSIDDLREWHIRLQWRPEAQAAIIEALDRYLRRLLRSDAMYSHTTLGTNDPDRARAFYEPVMATLGLTQPFQLPASLVFGDMTGPKLFIVKPFDGAPAASGNGPHLAFLAPSRAAVDAFHAAALANGGTDEGAPGLRPYYHPNYYGAYVRDPDGNKLQAVCHSSKG